LSTRTERMRRRVLLMPVARNIAEHPLETGMIIWGLYTGFQAAIGEPSSRSLQSLPPTVARMWAVFMVVAAITVFIGVFLRGFQRTIAAGMYLFSATMVAYAATVIGTSGWQHGGSISTLLTVIAIVCMLRGWWLKDRETAVLTEMTRTPEGPHADEHP
jgi:hypothetical protein